MSSAPIAVLDCDVLGFLAGDEKHKERTEIVRGRIKAMREKGYRLYVPSPALAELCTRGPTMQQLAQQLSPRMGGFRTAEFGVQAAQVCGQMIAEKLARAKAGASPYDSTRAAMKYDAQIAAIAHAMQAKYLVTANARDFRVYLEAVKSTTEVHRADETNLAFAHQERFAVVDDPLLDVRMDLKRRSRKALPLRPQRLGDDTGDD